MGPDRRHGSRHRLSQFPYRPGPLDLGFVEVALQLGDAVLQARDLRLHTCTTETRRMPVRAWFDHLHIGEMLTHFGVPGSGIQCVGVKCSSGSRTLLM